MSQLEDIDALAADYVLGTLDARERADVEARRAREPVLAAAIAAWERRLAPLAGTVKAITPPADMLSRIERRLGVASAGDGGGGAEVISLLEARVKRWRNVALGASALAASLVLAIGVRETMVPKPQSYVAVFNQGDVLPSFTMTIDLATREVTVRPIGASRQPGRTYQLWIASDQLGPGPRSLGLLGDGGAPARVSLATYEPALLQRATFGVSLEEAGGSRSGRPTEPALHSKLVPVAN